MDRNYICNPISMTISAYLFETKIPKRVTLLQIFLLTHRRIYEPVFQCWTLRFRLISRGDQKQQRIGSKGHLLVGQISPAVSFVSCFCQTKVFFRQVSFIPNLMFSSLSLFCFLQLNVQ